MHHRRTVAIYNLGQARRGLFWIWPGCFQALDKPRSIEFIDTANWHSWQVSILHWSKNGKLKDWLRQALSFFGRRCHRLCAKLPGEDVAGQYSWPSTCEWWSFGSLFSPLSCPLSKHTSQEGMCVTLTLYRPGIHRLNFQTRLPAHLHPWCGGGNNRATPLICKIRTWDWGKIWLLNFVNYAVLQGLWRGTDQTFCCSLCLKINTE